MAKKQKYSEAQKRAYYSGQGYRAGQESKVIPFKNPKNKESFKQGYRSVKIIVANYPEKK